MLVLMCIAQHLFEENERANLYVVSFEVLNVTNRPLRIYEILLCYSIMLFKLFQVTEY